MQHKSAVQALTIQKNRLVASVALIEAGRRLDHGRR
jgi:hypothetical protein